MRIGYMLISHGTHCPSIVGKEYCVTTQITATWDQSIKYQVSNEKKLSEKIHLIFIIVKGQALFVLIYFQFISSLQKFCVSKFSVLEKTCYVLLIGNPLMSRPF